MKTKDLGNKRIMSNNIKRHLAQRGLNVKDFSTEMDFKYTTVLDWVNAKTYPRIDKIELMARYFGVDKSDLVEEYNPIKEKQSTTKQILDRVFAKLESERQEKVVSYAEAQLRDQNSNNTIQLFPYQVQEKLSAGTGYAYEENAVYEIVFSDKEIDYDFASRINGDSMEPDYHDRDVALIKESPFDYDGCVYAVDWDGQSYIKKVYREEEGFRLVSTNEKYADKFAAFTEEPRIIGKVIGSFTPIQKSV
jgi:repressor LexA